MQESGKGIAVFRPVDHWSGSSQDRISRLVEGKSEIVGDLAADRDDDSKRLFEIGNIAHSFESQFLEVKSVRFIEVGRDGLRIGIDQDHLAPFLAQGAGHVDGAPIELDGGTDAIRAGT